MKIEIIYLRNLYPTGWSEITKTPYGHYIEKCIGTWPPYETSIGIEKSLQQIQEKHEIETKIEYVTTQGLLEEVIAEYPMLKSHNELYEEIMDASDTLKARGKKYLRPDQTFRTRKDRGPGVGNTLLIKVDGEIQWFEHMYPSILIFLNSTVDGGVHFVRERLSKLLEPSRLDYIVSGGGTPKETELINKLLDSGYIGYGRYESEYPVGYKFIDLLLEKEDEYWIIEAKEQLNWSAIGQVMGYSVLFDKLYNQGLLMLPKKTINRGIVYSITDPDLEICCDELGIKRFPEEVL